MHARNTNSDLSLRRVGTGSRLLVTISMFIALFTYVATTAIVGFGVSVRLFTDVTWWGTVLAFAPRWPLALPLVVLVPAAVAIGRWRLLAVQGAVALVLVGPVMGFHLGPPGQACPTLSGLNLRVLTCNVQGNAINIAALQSLIDEVAPDIIALQECAPSLIERLFGNEEWQTHSEGGLSIASRFPIERVESFDRQPYGGWGSVALLCRLQTREGPIEFVNVHLSTARPGLETLRWSQSRGISELKQGIVLRRRESEDLRQRIGVAGIPLVMVGDFNMPIESAIYHDCWSGYRNAFSSTGLGFGETKRTRWHGVRIDHVLADAHWKPVCCRVGPDVGSDHLPLVAELRRISSITSLWDEEGY
jgi:vancomycin resistance protein VanJ